MCCSMARRVGFSNTVGSPFVTYAVNEVFNLTTAPCKTSLVTDIVNGKNDHHI